MSLSVYQIAICAHLGGIANCVVYIYINRFVLMGGGYLSNQFLNRYVSVGPKELWLLHGSIWAM